MSKSVRTGSGKTQAHICDADLAEVERYVDMRALRGRKIERQEHLCVPRFPDLENIDDAYNVHP